MKLNTPHGLVGCGVGCIGAFTSIKRGSGDEDVLSTYRPGDVGVMKDVDVYGVGGVKVRVWLRYVADTGPVDCGMNESVSD